jgi:hypothetical protein
MTWLMQDPTVLSLATQDRVLYATSLNAAHDGADEVIEEEEEEEENMDEDEFADVDMDEFLNFESVPESKSLAQLTPAPSASPPQMHGSEDVDERMKSMYPQLSLALHAKGMSKPVKKKKVKRVGCKALTMGTRVVFPAIKTQSESEADYQQGVLQRTSGEGKHLGK